MEPHTLRPPVDRGTGPADLPLVQRALTGDGAAVEDLLGRLACVGRFVWRLNKSLGYGLPAEALEDVVQQVYAAMWPRLPDFAGTAALESWAFGFCRNCVRAEARRRAQRHRGRQSLEVDELQAAAGGAELAPHGAEGVEALDALQEELQRLQPLEREVVELRHLAGLSFEEIARQKGLPPSTVKDRCYRALLRVRGRLQRRHVVT